MENDKYTSYDSDRLDEGSELKVHHTVYLKETDMTELVSKPLDEVLDMREKCAKLELAAFNVVRKAAVIWEEKAADTRLLDRGIKYLKMPEVQHTSNKWDKDKYGDFDTISNKVYKMRVRMDEYENYRTGKPRWDVRWHVYTNSPRDNCNVKVAGQERSFSDKESAEKYVQGRIKAYSHLFTEISPPIPKEYEPPFRLYGQLLPGYTTEAMVQEQKAERTEKSNDKPSIRRQLNELKGKDKVKTVPDKEKKRTELELS